MSLAWVGSRVALCQGMVGETEGGGEWVRKETGSEGTERWSNLVRERGRERRRGRDGEEWAVTVKKLSYGQRRQERKECRNTISYSYFRQPLVRETNKKSTNCINTTTFVQTHRCRKYKLTFQGGLVASSSRECFWQTKFPHSQPIAYYAAT